MTPDCLWHINVKRQGWQNLAYAMTRTRAQAEMVLDAVREDATDAELHRCCDQGAEGEEECYIWTPETGWTPGAWP